MLTVSEAMQTAALAGCAVVGGLDGTGRSIESLNQMDVPDVVDWVAPHQMIVTTGYFIRNNVSEQRQLLIELNERKCAGLAIKVKRYFRTIPQEMIELADKLQFPLIEIPADKNISTIMNELMREIANKQAVLLKHAYDVHNCFTTAVLKGGSLKNIADILVSFVNNGVIIYDDAWNVLSYSQPQGSALELTAILQEVNLEECFKTSLLMTAPVDVYHSQAVFRGMSIAVAIYPIVHDLRLMGYIYILGGAMQNATVSDKAAIEQAAMVAGLELLKRKISREMQQNLRADFFNDYLGGNIKSKAVLERRGAQYGINVAEKYLCLVLGIDHFNNIFLNKFSGNEPLVQKLKQEVACIAETVMARANLSRICFSKSDQLIIILPCSLFDRNSKSMVCDLVNTFKQEIRRNYPAWLTVSAGVGLAGAAVNVPQSYKLALEAMRLGRNLAKNSTDGLYFFEEHMVEYLLAEVDWNKYEFLYEDTLGQVAEFDRKNAKMELIKTLQALIECGFNLSTTAQVLYIHRNTLTYRMDKIRELMNLDLANNQVRMFLMVLMKMKSMQESREA